MKFRTVVLTVWILIAGISGYAKVIPCRPFFLEREITVNGAKVPEGMYTLSLESHGAFVRATLLRDGRFIATARGTWVKHGIKYTENTALLRVNSDGTRSLTEIRLAGSAKTIVIDSETETPRRAPEPRSIGANSSNGTLN